MLANALGAVERVQLMTLFIVLFAPRKVVQQEKIANNIERLAGIDIYHRHQRRHGIIKWLILSRNYL
jgi:hypothetical protein